MKTAKSDNELHPGITMHKIPVKAGFAGLLFTLGIMFVCLMGIPATMYFFVLAIVLGIGIAVMLRFIPRQAGVVVLVLTGVMIVCLAGTPSTGEWRMEEEIDVSRAILPPPPPPPTGLGELSVYRCDCRPSKAKQPCDSKSWRGREGQKRSLP